MKRYFAVEVSRTVSERRIINVCVQDIGTAQDFVVENAESERVRTPWINPRTNYSTDRTTKIDWPAYVDVTPQQQTK
jgi:hypothetical protein